MAHVQLPIEVAEKMVLTIQQQLEHLMTYLHKLPITSERQKSRREEALEKAVLWIIRRQREITNNASHQDNCQCDFCNALYGIERWYTGSANVDNVWNKDSIYEQKTKEKMG